MTVGRDTRARYWTLATCGRICVTRNGSRSALLGTEAFLLIVVRHLLGPADLRRLWSTSVNVEWTKIQLAGQPASTTVHEVTNRILAEGGISMKRLGLVIVFVFLVSLLASGFAVAADDTKVKKATNQVESGAKKIPEGVKETAKGIGKTASEGTKYSGEKLKAAGEAAAPPAKSAWGNARDGAVGFGQTVKVFFTNLFSR
jgi:hypothetical protein